jgi:hypothetical protein
MEEDYREMGLKKPFDIEQNKNQKGALGHLL